MFKKQVKSCVIVLMAIILCMAALPGYEAAAASHGTSVNEAIGLKMVKSSQVHYRMKRKSRGMKSRHLHKRWQNIHTCKFL